MNLGTLTSKSTNVPFLNVMKVCDRWYLNEAADPDPESESEYPDGFTAIEQVFGFDLVDGYPSTGLPRTLPLPLNGDPGEYRVATKMQVGLGALKELGTYQVSFEGNGDLEFFGDVVDPTPTKSPVASGNGSYYLITLTAGSEGIGLIVTDSDPGANRVRNVRVIHGDYVDATSGDPDDTLLANTTFHPKWLALLDELNPTALRFGKFKGINASVVASPATETVREHYSWVPFGDRGGVPYEVCVELCDAVGAAFWIQIPTLSMLPVDTDVNGLPVFCPSYSQVTFTHVFDLIQNQGYSNVPEVLVQYGNELWTSQAAGALPAEETNIGQWLADRAAEYNLAPHEFYALAATRIHDVAHNVALSTGFPTADVRRLIGGHRVDATNWAGAILGYIDSDIDPGNVAGRVDAIATSGYFGNRAEANVGWLSPPFPGTDPWHPSGLVGMATDWDTAGRLSSGLDPLFEYLRDSIDDLGPGPGSMSAAPGETIHHYLDQHRVIADQYSLDLVVYEGGPHLDFKYDPSKDPVDTELVEDYMLAAQTDPRMRDMLLVAYDDWRTSFGGDHYLHFDFIEKFTNAPTGYYGLLLLLDPSDPIPPGADPDYFKGLSPKYSAVYESRMASGGGS